ncbi:hypothetical protein EDD30_4324 [Couchioplanes caeruleus]|uniref:Heparinase II/III-like protein n=2 Tax=Couchioplanes caeruleus TaxID=56438 RepID=A0A3N1GME7_9ACTN|nr:hypothetical protein EDD30_4324 [Couchioplanes caeruleus]
MGEKVRRKIAGIAVIALAAGILHGSSAAAEAADVHVIPIDPVLTEDPDALLDLYRAGTVRAQLADPTASARCGAAAPGPVPDGEDIVVKLSPAAPFTVGKINPTTWRRPPVADPTWRMGYEGLMWMRPLARRAAMDGQTKSLDALVDQVVSFHAKNPDPKSNSYGWDEGTALRRLETENCLYALTGSEKLRKPIFNDVNVLLGFRYYGPPYAPVHNHGLMANLQIIRAGDHLHRADWTKRASDRLVAEAPLAFSKRGVIWEQASQYQVVNADLWDQAARTLAESPGTGAAVTSIRRSVANARTAFTWMTEPDGKIVQIGDSEKIDGEAANPSRAPRTFRDDQTGWIIGRWSWTDPKTSYYTIRYGPSRRAHGHHDRAGGVTYTAKGVRVLVGPGKYNYDRKNNFYAYQISAQSHNVPIPAKGKAGNGASTVSGSVAQAAAHAWTIKNTVYGTGRAHSRNVNVNRDASRMTVTDKFPKAQLWRQYWHLDPQWRRVSGVKNGKTLVFAHPSGRKLRITTTGAVSGFVKGITRPPAGWHYPSFGNRVQAYEIVIRSTAPTLTTTFTVS